MRIPTTQTVPSPNAVPDKRGSVLLVSALPPPVGGLATWTGMIVDRGLPDPFDIEVVDTRTIREHFSATTRLNFAELRRTAGILSGIRAGVNSGRFSLMHLNCSLYLAGAPRNLVSALLARRAEFHTFRTCTDRSKSRVVVRRWPGSSVSPTV